MKKAIAASLCALILSMIFVRAVQISNDSIKKYGNLENPHMVTFSIPDNDMVCEPDALFSALSETSEKTESNIVRVSITEGAERNTYVFNKYVLLSHPDSDYCKAFDIEAGRFLSAEETFDRDSEAFVSSEKTKESGQVGVIGAHMLGTEVNVYPYGRVFNSLKADGLYYAELKDGVSLEDFLAVLQSNIEENSGVHLEISELEGGTSNIGIPARDATAYVLVFLIILLLFILLVFYYLLKHKRNAAIMRLMGIGTKTILWRTCGIFVFVYPAEMLAAVFVIGIIAKDIRYLAEISVPAWLLYPVVLLFFAGAFMIVNGKGNYVQALKGRSFTRGILVIQMTAEFITLAVILYAGSSVWNYSAELRNSLREYGGWSAADDYGVFYPLYHGDEQTDEEELQRKVVFGTDLYQYLNERGAVFADARAFEDPSELAGSAVYEAQMSKVSHGYQKSFAINPNYLKKFPVYDTQGSQITVNEDETSLVLIVPESYRDDEDEIRSYYCEYQADNRENDEEYYGLSPSIPEQQDIKIIWAESGQQVFTFDPDINDTGMIEIPVLEVITDNNSYVTQRQGILGGGNRDPLKIRLDQDSACTYAEILPELENLGLDDNLKALVSVNEKAAAERAITRSNLRLSIGTMLIFLVIAVFLIYQSTVLVFDENKIKYTVKAVFGIRWRHIYKNYLTLKTAAMALLCAGLGFIDSYSDKQYLMLACVFLIVVQFLIIYGCTDRLQKRSTVAVLKGE